MMLRKIILIMYVLVTRNFLFSQDRKLAVYANFNQQKLNPEVYYKLNARDSVQVTSFKFYISQLELLDGSKTVWKEQASFHLIDAFDAKTLVLSIPSNITFTKLKFQLGIDSLTNVSGALGGDLDPTKGMYWTWQSGYINFKLEGNSNLCKTRHNEFQFHLGGYQQPFNCLQTVFVQVKSKANITLNMDVAKLLLYIQLSELNHIMSPSKEAVELSGKITETFSVSYE